MRNHFVRLVALMVGLAPSIGLGGFIGETAPPLVVKEWIKGEPVQVKAGTNIYVVEIWATSSASSRTSITDLNALQQRFKSKGVVIVGVSDESIEKVKEFIDHVGTNIQYSIAADDRRKTSQSYMLPVRQLGVPYAFVVGTNGNLLWHGHPLRGLDKVLDQVIAGQYDLERARKADVASHQMEQYLGMARRGDPRARVVGRIVLENRTNDVMQLCDLAFQIATNSQITKRDFALAGEALDQAEKLAPTNTARVVITRAVLTFEAGNKEEGVARARQALASVQSPKDKTNIQAFLRTLEARLAEANTNRSGSPTDKP